MGDRARKAPSGIIFQDNRPPATALLAEEDSVEDSAVAQAGRATDLCSYSAVAAAEWEAQEALAAGRRALTRCGACSA